MSHTYDPDRFKAAIDEISLKYLPAMNELHDFFLEKARNGG